MRRRRESGARTYPPAPVPWNGLGQLSFAGSTNGDIAWPAANCLATKCERRRAWVPDELAEFVRRAKAAGYTDSTARSGMQYVRSVLKRAMGRLGRPVSVTELFDRIDLLAE